METLLNVKNHVGMCQTVEMLHHPTFLASFSIIFLFYLVIAVSICL